ncbi:hypothetical protein Pcinc_008443 [Petrolisthes cinctipes]|uniref:Prismalin-14 n=1 Tax=Petrolisthes cinctipes TaxID=88211 RepID=A0AAE1KZF7_PETCI|nr:hypothetical protein Pcinc_008443 [Petrolisthes cinctipes]
MAAITVRGMTCLAVVTVLLSILAMAHQAMASPDSSESHESYERYHVRPFFTGTQRRYPSNNRFSTGFSTGTYNRFPSKTYNRYPTRSSTHYSGSSYPTRSSNQYSGSRGYRRDYDDSLEHRYWF